jgi:hypothetical protein
MLVVDTGEDVIPKSLRLIAGRTAQEYNIRKKRKGAFWEDRYHATTVQTDEHLAKCLVYIDLNMVRAGVVGHPAAYGISGYNEIQTPPTRYSIINQQELSGRIPGRSIISENGMIPLQKPQSSYSTLLGGQKGFLTTENSYLLQLSG